MKIEVTNLLHARMCVLVVSRLPHTLSRSQQRKVSALCGHSDCECWSHEISDEDGNQVVVESYADDGRWIIGYASSGPVA